MGPPGTAEVILPPQRGSNSHCLAGPLRPDPEESSFWISICFLGPKSTTILAGRCADFKQKYDLNDNGKIDPEEREIMLEDRRRIMIDADAKRDAQRRMAWFSLTGMLLFPFGVVFTEWMQLPRASEMLSSMSNIYYVSIAAIVAAYYGFTNMGKKE